MKEIIIAVLIILIIFFIGIHLEQERIRIADFFELIKQDAIRFNV